mmetsp:Transcript_25457/g.37540  ORF Transcript_25457/g.37540 Transcript_25457/m.37540 type:complete len:331 (-) Transcript_25457:566-1558(-)
MLSVAFFMIIHLHYVQSTHFHSTIPHKDSLIGGKFKIHSYLRSGGHGTVYLGLNTLNGVEVVVKFEPHSNRDELQHEFNVLSLLNNTEGIAHAYWFGDTEDGKYSALVQQRLGGNMHQELKTKINLWPTERHRENCIKNLLIFAYQAVRLLERIHSSGIIHSDIKPENFVVGLDSENSTIYLIDFGRSSTYMDSTGHHVEYMDGLAVTGTPEFMAFNTMLGVAETRRDDVEALGYTIASMYPDYILPWRKHIDATSDKRKRLELIMVSMARTPLAILCEGLPEEICLYFKHVKGLGYFETPGYSYLKNLFSAAYDRRYSGEIQYAMLEPL